MAPAVHDGTSPWWSAHGGNGSGPEWCRPGGSGGDQQEGRSVGRAHQGRCQGDRSRGHDADGGVLPGPGFPAAARGSVTSVAQLPGPGSARHGPGGRRRRRYGDQGEYLADDDLRPESHGRRSWVEEREAGDQGPGDAPAWAVQPDHGDHLQRGPPDDRQRSHPDGQGGLRSCFRRGLRAGGRQGRGGRPGLGRRRAGEPQRAEGVLRARQWPVVRVGGLAPTAGLRAVQRSRACAHAQPGRGAQALHGDLHAFGRGQGP